MPITAIREIKILKQLNHRNIVPLIDLAVEKVVENGQVKRQAVYMVFPYMDHDLAGLLDNPSVKLSLPQIKTYMQQLLEGTAYLHHVSFTRRCGRLSYNITHNICRTRSCIVISKVMILKR